MSDTNRDHSLAKYWLGSQAAVASYVASMVPNFHDTEDIMQRVASTVIEKFELYDPERPFVAWAIGIARYEILNYRREKMRDRHIFSDAATQRIEAAFAHIAPDIERYRSALHHCSARLAMRSQKILEMRYLQGLKPAKIAARLGMSSDAVSAQLYRVRTVLRDCVERRIRSEEAGR